MFDREHERRLLILGAHGQIGQALVAAMPPGIVVRGLARADLDIGVAGDIAAVLHNWRPNVVINAAGSTDVDGAERDPMRAFARNCAAPAKLAAAAKLAGVRRVHVSSDYVFNGTLRIPYRPDAPTLPLGMYGASKAAGEDAVRAALPNALIVRTARIYASQGRNFVFAMLKSMRSPLHVKVVVDQVGTPTHARSFAQGLWSLVLRGAQGTCHLTDGGSASRYGFATAIAQMAFSRGILTCAPVIIATRSANFQTLTRRPLYSVLNCSSAWSQPDHPPPSWMTELGTMLDELKALGAAKEYFA